MQLEVGSNFWDYSLNELRTHKFWWEEDSYIKYYLKSGRNAFMALCSTIATENKTVLFPAYHCETESDPWYDRNWNVCYYPVEKDFTVMAEKLKVCVEKFQPSVLVIQSYFGFETLDNECDIFLEECKKQGIIIIEDITQSILSDIRHKVADYYVASFRKFFAIPDGGVIISRNQIEIGEMADSDKEIPIKALEAYQLKREYFTSKDKRIKEKFRTAYIELNSLISQNDKLYRMSDVARKILNSIDVRSIGKKRRTNYHLLYEGLTNVSCISLARKLDDVTIPLFLPVLVNEGYSKKDLQAYLAQQDIYCPIIWQKSGKILDCPSESQEIYTRILCFPIDQRYDATDIQRVINAVQEWDK